MSNFRYNITKPCIICDSLYIANLLEAGDCICDRCLNTVVDKVEDDEYSSIKVKKELFLDLNPNGYRTEAIFYD